MPADHRLSAEEARLLLWAAQSLPHGAGEPAAAVEESGLVRTLGGVDVYLALAARLARPRRKGVDGAVEKHLLQVVPTVRGCIYLVPRREASWCLRISDQLTARRREREHEKAGIRAGELERLAEQLVACLEEHGPLGTAALRQALPAGAVRSLGEAGKKLGIASPLPAALRLAEHDGRIERTLEGGRLDSERYRWRAAVENPFHQHPVGDDLPALYRHFAELYLRCAGLGTLEGFAQWCGLSKRDARAALEALAPVTVTVEDWQEERLALADRLQELSEREPRRGVALLPFEDNLIHLQGGPASLTGAHHHERPVPQWGRSKAETLGASRHMSFRSVVVDGEILGFWEMDPDSGVVWALFEEPSRKLRDAVAAEADATARFIRDELGHGRSFSLDTDDDLRRRAEQIRSLRP